jgi:hypothetical protein
MKRASGVHIARSINGNSVGDIGAGTTESGNTDLWGGGSPRQSGGWMHNGKVDGRDTDKHTDCAQATPCTNEKYHEANPIHFPLPPTQQLPQVTCPHG